MGMFAKLAAPVANGWEEKLKAQEQRLHSIVPSTEEETRAKALETIKKVRDTAYAFGYAMRMKQQAKGTQKLLADPTAGVPGREVLVDLPASELASLPPKAAGFLSDLVTKPVVEFGEDAWQTLRDYVDKRKDKLMRVTDDPTTLPWFIPGVTSTLRRSTMQGYQDADSVRRKAEDEAASAKMEAAKREFESALRAEYDLAKRQKAASAGELIDGLGQLIVKAADGELNQILGAYLALGELAQAGTHNVVEDWMKKRDPQQQYAAAMKELLKRRMRENPPPIQIASHIYDRPAETVEAPKPSESSGLELEPATAPAIVA
jgi:hypothetical protein